jgi:hypothetical protein
MLPVDAPWLTSRWKRFLFLNVHCLGVVYLKRNRRAEGLDYGSVSGGEDGGKKINPRSHKICCSRTDSDVLENIPGLVAPEALSKES